MSCFIGWRARIIKEEENQGGENEGKPWNWRAYAHWFFLPLLGMGVLLMEMIIMMKEKKEREKSDRWN